MEYTGTVVDGVVVIEDARSLPEGTRVRIIPLTRPAAAAMLGERLLQFAGSAPGLPEDMAENHDHYLHGRPKK